MFILLKTIYLYKYRYFNIVKDYFNIVKDDELLKLTSYVQISKYREKRLKSIGNDVKIPTNS